MSIEKWMWFTTVAFGIVGTLGLIDQTKKIWSNKSAKSVSGMAVITFTSLFVSFFIYGLQVSNYPMMLHGGLRTVFWIPVLLGFFVYGNLNWRHWLMLASCTVLLSIMADPRRSILVFWIFSIMSVWFSVIQAYAIVENRARGTVSLANQVIPCLSASVWVVYALLMKDVWLAGSTACSAASYLLVIGAWVKYPNPKTIQL